MFKRIVALFMCLCLLFTAIPFFASAEQSEDARIREQIKKVYRRALYTTGKSSLNGFCGLMTSYQLWLLGVTPYPLTQDGKNMFDYYKDTELTATGHNVDMYYAKDYSLEEALNLVSHCGTRDVYNIMVGFQRTNTAAGSIYGHAMVIHAILDGTVYFVEGFRTSIGGPEGSVITCSISEFADFYNEWCKYEGIVVFGKKDYTDFCQEYATDLFALADGEAVLLSKPCSVGQQECRALRQTIPGERLRITDVLSGEEELYYRVEDGGQVGYIPAHALGILQTVEGGVSLSDAVLPETLAPGQGFSLGGEITSQNSLLTALSVTVSDGAGVPVLATEAEASGRMADLNRACLDFASLPQGAYTLTVSAKVVNNHVADGVVQPVESWVELSKTALCVGEATADVPAASAVKDGWVWENDNWYFYQNGAPRTGWYCYEGVDYYFLNDGAAATGWHEINGRWRCFTAQGAMRTGWVETEQGVLYMLSNGVAATGWRQIGENLYFFDTAGLMVTEGALEYNGVTYNIGADGIAFVGSHTPSES